MIATFDACSSSVSVSPRPSVMLRFCICGICHVYPRDRRVRNGLRSPQPACPRSSAARRSRCNACSFPGCTEVVVGDVLPLLKLLVILRIRHKRGTLRHRKHVGAVVRKLLQHKRIRSIYQRHDRDHAGHADDHAKQRQHRTQLVRPQRLQRKLQRFFEFHRAALLSRSSTVHPTAVVRRRKCSRGRFPFATHTTERQFPALASSLLRRTSTQTKRAAINRA